MDEIIAKSFEDDQKRVTEALIEELILFLAPYFKSNEEAEEFIKICEEHPNPTPKRVLHQIYRHISLSDEMAYLKTGSVKDSLQVFFWIVTIEAIFKAETPYSKLKKSEIVRNFFKDYINEADQKLLIRSISRCDKPFEKTTINTVADMFNTVRNMVAHEGIYWFFTFPEKEGNDQIGLIPKEKTSFLSIYTMGEENFSIYTVSITKEIVRDIIIKGSLNFLGKVLEDYKDN
ncbi:hypothetical protein [Ornithinibacillus halophilus]|uniref:Abi-like protein n=1 Tax=Ornithinibacillus halophilus TaxID=930117 RepID=A0A1M5FG02_9BACI|nr:hypothetical protein [Ornithinibacillus halophilus]SHF90423.1 hypothetical protein SAMN05216225_100873 [Ornithinibacillus halophilus]